MSLVLKRLSLTKAIAGVEKSIKDAAAALITHKRERIAAFAKTYGEALAAMQKSVAVTEKAFKAATKNLAKSDPDYLIETLNALDAHWSLSTGAVLGHNYHYGVSRNTTPCFDEARAEQQLRTLRGLLAMMDGDELVMSNSLAEKFLGKVDILGLIS